MTIDKNHKPRWSSRSSAEQLPSHAEQLPSHSEEALEGVNRAAHSAEEGGAPREGQVISFQEGADFERPHSSEGGREHQALERQELEREELCGEVSEGRYTSNIAAEDVMERRLEAQVAPLSTELSQAPYTITPPPRCSPPVVELRPVVRLTREAPEGLRFDELRADERVEVLRDQARLILPTQIKEGGSRMSPKISLSFDVGEEGETLYAKLAKLGDWSEGAPEEGLELLERALELFAELEEAGCPPLSLDHELVWWQPSADVVSVWAALRAHVGWSESAAAWLTHCLLLCCHMGGPELASNGELLEVLAVLHDSLNPRQLDALRRGLQGEYERVEELLSAFQEAREAPSVTGRVEAFDRVSDQRVGAQKRRKRAHKHLSLERQQEDRLVEGSFMLDGERYWLGAVFDGVSTCDFGSGAQVAEAAREGVAKALKALPAREDLPALLQEHGPKVILDFVQSHITKCVVSALEQLASEAGVSLDDKSLHLPTSTATIALLDERAQAYLKWVGDSPAMIISAEGELMNVCSPHSALHSLVLEGCELYEALQAEGGSALTRELSSLALGDSNDVDHRQVQLREGEGLLLCSDGLIDGFKEERKRPGAEAKALSALEACLQRQREEGADLYEQVTELCHQADRLRGVDNISALIVAPIWRQEAQAPQAHSSRSRGDDSERSYSERSYSERSYSERSYSERSPSHVSSRLEVIDVSEPARKRSRRSKNSKRF